MSAQLAILGLLVEQPLHGYGIEGLIEERGMRKWTPVGFSSIYQLLDQLVSNGWADVHVEPAPGRGKQRRVHQITEAGRGHWQREVLAALGDVDASAGTVLIALSGIPFLDRADAVAALEQRAERLTSRLADLDADLAAARPVPDHVEAMFTFVATRLRSERDWTTSYVTDLTITEQEPPP